MEYLTGPRKGSIADVPGIRVGQAEDPAGLTGITVVLSEQGACGGVSVIGGAPGTRETDLLRPAYTVDQVHAVFLTGGSAFGLSAAEGIVRFLEERGVGFDIGVPGIPKVPIVPGAVIFDLGVGDPGARPTPEMAYAACQAAAAGGRGVASGSHGAGTGATVGKWMGTTQCMRGGVGTASTKLGADGLCGRGRHDVGSGGGVGNHTVGVIVVVNAVGDVVDPSTGRVVAGAFDKEHRHFCSEPQCGELPREPQSDTDHLLANTTIAVVATDAILSKAECARVALMAAGGVAQAIRPSFTPMDGDTVFVLSTGAALTGGSQSSSLPNSPVASASRTRLVTEVGMAAQRLVVTAILDAVLSATSLPGIPSARDVK